jgi:hypothetical protein
VPVGIHEIISGTDGELRFFPANLDSADPDAGAGFGFAVTYAQFWGYCCPVFLTDLKLQPVGAGVDFGTGD